MNLLNTRDLLGLTPLALAAQHGHGSIVQLLIGLDRIDVNGKDSRGLTPLSQALYNGHANMVKMLLDISPNRGITNAKSSRGLGSLSKALYDSHANIVKMLLDFAPKREIARNVPPNWENPRHIRSQTPLYFAAQNGHASIVKMLLDSDPRTDANAKNVAGRAPLCAAAINGLAGVVKMLLDLGPDRLDLNAKDIWGRTAAWWANKYRHYSIVELLDKAQVGSVAGVSKRMTKRKIDRDMEADDQEASATI